MTKLIINADDFGYSNGVNYGIMEAHLEGILTSTTLMANMPGFNHAVDLSKIMPELGIGVHLTLTCGKPLLSDVPSLVGENGKFKANKLHIENKANVDLDELYREWDAQIKKVIDSGIKPTHLDSHHHIHTVNNYHVILTKLARKYNLPVRSCFNLDKKADLEGIKMNDMFLDTYYNEVIRDTKFKYAEVRDLINSSFKNDFARALDYDVVELMCHPAYIDTELMEGSSFNIQRLRELDSLKDPLIKETLEHFTNIKLSTYRDI